jgi:hypothetical protein
MNSNTSAGANTRPAFHYHVLSLYLQNFVRLVNDEKYVINSKVGRLYCVS